MSLLLSLGVIMNQLSLRNRRKRKFKAPLKRKAARLHNNNFGELPISLFRNWPPRNMYCRLLFDMGGSSTTTTSVGEIILAANDPFDPGLSLSALQPTWFDQVTPFYRKYRVWACKIEASAHNSTASVPYTIAVYPSTSSTAATTIGDSVSQRLCRFQQGGGSGGMDGTRIQHFMKSSTMFGTPIGTSTDYGGATSGSPSIKWYWYVSAQATDGTTSCTILYEIRITMFIELYDLNFANLSSTRSKRFCLVSSSAHDSDQKEESLELV